MLRMMAPLMVLMTCLVSVAGWPVANLTNTQASNETKSSEIDTNEIVKDALVGAIVKAAKKRIAQKRRLQSTMDVLDDLGVTESSQQPLLLYVCIFFAKVVTISASLGLHNGLHAPRPGMRLALQGLLSYRYVESLVRLGLAVYQFVNIEGLTWWQCCNGIALMLGTSPCSGTCLILCGSPMLLIHTCLWRALHKREFDCWMLESKLGGYKWVIAQLAGLHQSYCCFPLFVYCLPAIIMYGWFFFPVLTIHRFVIAPGVAVSLMFCVRRVCRCMSYCFATIEAAMGDDNEEQQQAEALGNETDIDNLHTVGLFAPEDAKYYRMVACKEDRTEYAINAAAYSSTGVPFNGWRNYAFWVCEALAAPFMCVMATRFYTGCGYMDSFTGAFLDRPLLPAYEDDSVRKCILHFIADVWRGLF
mmetsp:Transcript_55845/g.103359  ORF Transcript_55845/g.103359 Transcript_55845/m.103359 type:complete len:417 (+) Transcript_55845:62-1312(+)